MIHSLTSREWGLRGEGGGGIYLNAIFPPLDMALMEISRSRFKQKLNTDPANLCCGVFCEFLGDFWVYLGVFLSRRIG